MHVDYIRQLVRKMKKRGDRIQHLRLTITCDLRLLAAYAIKTNEKQPKQ